MELHQTGETQVPDYHPLENGDNSFFLITAESSHDFTESGYNTLGDFTARWVVWGKPKST